jgi:transposase-like protein
MAKHRPKQYFDDAGGLIIKPYRISDLATIFDIHRDTMRKWMLSYPEQLTKREGKYFSVRQVEFIIEKFGRPSKAA